MRRLLQRVYEKRMTGFVLFLGIPGVIANWTYAQAPAVNVITMNQMVDNRANHPIQSRVAPAVHQIEFSWPVNGHITSGFGYRRLPMEGASRFHQGIDIAASYGTPILASQAGRVVHAGWYGLMGKCVIIQHNNDYMTCYGHCSRTLVHAGQQVEKGQEIALVGSTGLATGPHVHFEIRRDGVPVNPAKYLF